MLLFDTAREASDEAGMLEALAAFEKLLGRTSAEWKYCEAARRVWQVRNRPTDRQSLVTASRLLKQAAAVRPLWQRIPCLEAEMAVMEGRLDEAIQEFRHASEIAALNRGDMGQYVRLLYVRGRYEEAREMLRKAWVGETTPGLKMLGSELEMRAGNKQSSLELAAAAALESQNPIDHQWYAQLLQRAGKPADAETAFRRAVGLGQQIPELWLSLIEHLSSHGKRAQALEAVRNAQLLLPEDRVPLILGQSFQALGEQAQADAQGIQAMAEVTSEVTERWDSPEFMSLVERYFTEGVAPSLRNLALNDLTLAEQYLRSGAALYPDNFGIVGGVANFFVTRNLLPRAVPYLEQLLRLGAARNSPSDRAPLVWARRTLAVHLASQGGYREQQ